MSPQTLKAFYRLLLPVLVFLLGNSITEYVERIFLAQYSEMAWAGSLNGFFLARIFQLSSSAVVIGGQAFVGLFHGANQPRQIGPCIWQLIWFSLGTVLVVPPVGFFLENLLYHNTALSQEEGGYFAILCWFNFLIPLNAALSAFYIARGKTILVAFLNVGACVINICLDYSLVFGNSLFAPMGSVGASLGKVIAQGLLCLMLGLLFLQSENHKIFRTREWKFQPLLFMHYLKPGLFRALGVIFCFIDWSFVSRTISLLSETHRLIYSLGVTIFYSFTFFVDAVFQSMITLESNHIGREQPQEIWKIFRGGVIIIAIYFLILGIPFFIYPQSFLLFFKATSFHQEMLPLLYAILPSVWLALIGYGLSVIALSIIVASRDTFFLCRYYAMIWLFSALPTYGLMVLLELPADKFWYIVSFTNFTSFAIYLKRMFKEKWLTNTWAPPAPYKSFSH